MYRWWTIYCPLMKSGDQNAQINTLKSKKINLSLTLSSEPPKSRKCDRYNIVILIQRVFRQKIETANQPTVG